MLGWISDFVKGIMQGYVAFLGLGRLYDCFIPGSALGFILLVVFMSG